MRHDYDLPPDWEDFSDEEKSRWLTQERCRRQADRQGTNVNADVLEEEEESIERRIEARPGFVRLSEYR